MADLFAELENVTSCAFPRVRPDLTPADPTTDTTVCCTDWPHLVCRHWARIFCDTPTATSGRNSAEGIHPSAHPDSEKVTTAEVSESLVASSPKQSSGGSDGIQNNMFRSCPPVVDRAFG